MPMKLPALFIFLIHSLFLNAQNLDIPVNFQSLLSQVGIHFNTPRDAAYKDIRILKNDFQDYQFAIFSKKEDLKH